MNKTTDRPVAFEKLSCGGNDFIICDARERELVKDPAGFSRAICHRTMGVGADGVIFLQTSENYPFFMKLHNADGGAAEVSYNGSRCLGLYARQKELADATFAFDSAAGEIRVEVTNTVVSLDVPAPTILKNALPLDSPWGKLMGVGFNAGVPYLVIAVPELNSPLLEAWATPLKKHPDFPQGTNVAIVQHGESSPVHSRFFERGVEEETMSSGTGTVAVAGYASISAGVTGCVDVLCSGGSFPVEFAGVGQKMSAVRTKAAVTRICSGEYYYSS